MATKKKSGEKAQNGQRPKVQVLHALDMQNVGIPASRPELQSKVQEKKLPLDNTVSETALTRLRKWNLSLAGVYIIQAVVIALLSVAERFAVTGSFLAKDPLQTAAVGQSVLVLATHHLFDINLTILVVALLAVVGIAHLLVATKSRPRYEADLVLNTNRMFWIGRIITSSLAMLLIAVVAGVQDISVLLAIVGFVVIANVGELVFEKHHTKGIVLMVLAKFAGFLPWVLVGLYLIFGGFYGNAVPAYVYWAFGVMYVGFAAMAASVWMRYKAIDKEESKWIDPTYTERVYTAIGFVTQTALAWILFAGVLHP